MKKKGFTLIELLAVIIILSIIALIATPIVLNVVEDAKKSAGESESNIIVNGINNYCEQEKFKESTNPGYISKCKEGINVDNVKELVNLGKSNIKEIIYDGSKVIHIVIESNNHIFTMCSNGKFVNEKETCEKYVINTGAIKDVIISHFPELETNGNGCINPGLNNYSYMGGCYIKAFGKNRKNQFYNVFDGLVVPSDYINIIFFNGKEISEANFQSNVFDDFFIELEIDYGASREEIIKELQGKTVFEYFFQKTPAELFNEQNGINIFKNEMKNLRLPKKYVDKLFFDKSGKFSNDNFENYVICSLAELNGVTENEILKDYPKGQIFEISFGINYEIFMNSPDIDNNLFYSGFLWRIMGINADGTIRLISAENISTVSRGLNNLADDWKGSYTNDWLNNYFLPRLKNNEILRNQKFCYESTKSEESIRQTCNENKLFETKIGILSLDEYNLAGNKYSYLNIDQHQSLITPYDNDSTWHISNGDLLHSFVYPNDGIRAIINVNPKTKIFSGNGSLDRLWTKNEGPFILNENKLNEENGNLFELVTIGEYIELAGKKYRVMDKSSTGIKMILDGYYEEKKDNIYFANFGNNGNFSLNSGIGQKLNTDVLRWLGINEKEKTKLSTNYEWYQSIYDYGDHYSESFSKTNKISENEVLVGLPKIGEILSTHSISILTNNFTVRHNNDLSDYWLMNKINNGLWQMLHYDLSNAEAEPTYNNAIRPVIVVKSNNIVIGGNGTWYNPYKI